MWKAAPPRHCNRCCQGLAWSPQLVPPLCAGGHLPAPARLCLAAFFSGRSLLCREQARSAMELMARGDLHPVTQWSWCTLRHSFPMSPLCCGGSPGMKAHAHGNNLLSNTSFVGVLRVTIPLPHLPKSVSWGHTNTRFAPNPYVRLCFWGTTVTNLSQFSLDCPSFQTGKSHILGPPYLSPRQTGAVDHPVRPHRQADHWTASSKVKYQL